MPQALPVLGHPLHHTLDLPPARGRITGAVAMARTLTTSQPPEQGFQHLPQGAARTPQEGEMVDIVEFACQRSDLGYDSVYTHHQIRFGPKASMTGPLIWRPSKAHHHPVAETHDRSALMMRWLVWFSAALLITIGIAQGPLTHAIFVLLGLLLVVQGVRLHSRHIRAKLPTTTPPTSFDVYTPQRHLS